MKTKVIIAANIIAAGVFLITGSCQKDDTTGNQNNSEDTVKVVLNEQSAAETVYSSDIYTGVISDVVVNSDKYDTKGANPIGCPDVSINPPAGYPKTLTIDYGPGCVRGGRTIKGKITATLSNKIWKKGTTVSIVFTNFAIDTIGVDGGISFTVDSVNHIMQKVYLNVQLSAFKLIMTNGTSTTGGAMFICWQRDTISGHSYDTVNVTSAAFSATTANNKSYNVTLLKTLVYPQACGHIVSGKLEVQEAGAAYPATVNFGTGTCDNTVEICTKKAITIGQQTIYQDHCFDISIP